MKKVAMLGDSILQMGYGTAIESALGDGYSVWRPDDNCRFISYVLRCLFNYKNKIGDADIVHWNSGEWDVCELFGDGPFTPEDFYVSEVLRVTRILLAQGKKVIFATTTPVREANQHNRNSVIRHYNELVVPKLLEMGVVINDLYSVVAADIEANIREDDNIHLTDEGIRLCAEATAKVIKSVCE